MKIKLAIALSVVSALFAFSAAASILPPPPTLPTQKSDCKNDGWQNYVGVFNNQGDCVSFVTTDGQNQPDGSN